MTEKEPMTTERVDPSRYERHSALGDCRWARDLWDAIHDDGRGNR